MSLDVEFEITSLQVEGYELSVPEGLSELMNRAGAWRYSKGDREDILKNYDRKVVIEDGAIRTYLICKSHSAAKFTKKTS